MAATISYANVDNERFATEKKKHMLVLHHVCNTVQIKLCK